MKAFYGMYIAYRNDYGLISLESKYQVSLILAIDKDTATGMLYNDAIKKYPRENGWRNHSILVSQISKLQLQTMLDQVEDD